MDSLSFFPYSLISWDGVYFCFFFSCPDVKGCFQKIEIPERKMGQFQMVHGFKSSENIILGLHLESWKLGCLRFETQLKGVRKQKQKGYKCHQLCPSTSLSEQGVCDPGHQAHPCKHFSASLPPPVFRWAGSGRGSRGRVGDSG